ncbi:hypothetical protein EDD21DRAFT_393844 [Dissophora ornata]|nr:hypothetical protein EDD21DRAFT_393844 [Dissophora ornata]
MRARVCVCVWCVRVFLKKTQWISDKLSRILIRSSIPAPLFLFRHRFIFLAWILYCWVADVFFFSSAIIRHTRNALLLLFFYIHNFSLLLLFFLEEYIVETKN